MADIGADLIAAAEGAADVAAAVIRPFFRAKLAAELKGDASPVTIADRAAEQAMRAVLRERCPGVGILGEEFPPERAGSRLCWTLDPIDGTRAFITGRPTFGTLIGLLDDGVPVLGVIDQPVSRERWIGVAGQTTRYRGMYGGQAGCRTCPRLEDAELSCTSPEMFTAAEWVRWQGLSRAVRRSTFGGDCYAHGLLALGQIDVIAESDMKVWDWAALCPVVEGAGGSVTDWRGAPLRFAPGATPVSGTVLSVGDRALLPHVLRLLGDA